MAWAVQHEQGSGFIETTFCNQVTASDLRKAVLRRIALQEKTGIAKVLADGSAVTIGPSTMDVFDLPSVFFAKHDAKRGTKIAIVLPSTEQPRELAMFFETASRNRGWYMKVFENRLDAVAWLMLDGTANNKK